jgi:hypothetical protein
VWPAATRVALPASSGVRRAGGLDRPLAGERGAELVAAVRGPRLGHPRLRVHGEELRVAARESRLVFLQERGDRNAWTGGACTA